MSLRDGAETIINQCLDVREGEKVLVLNDSNDKDLIDSLMEVLEDRGLEHELIVYEEVDSYGGEPPEHVADAMKNFDVVIAPTMKSLSHTEARKDANKAGARVATLPTVSKEIWNTSLQADYERVKEITEKVYSLLEQASEIRVTTPSGTDLSFEVDIDTYDRDTGILNEPGNFGNLPAGEPNGYPDKISGTLVIDHFPFSPKAEKVEIRNGEVVALESEGTESSKLEEAFEEHPCTKKIAEFGFGTNPEATLIGNPLQDEKVLGTVHFAFGDNCSYIDEGDERRNPCAIHWDSVCENPTVYFDDRKILEKGEPVFLEE
ncbi:aminopeptidase [Candidatus Nanosalina sp. VS9-1]|uniref:aminopeptidase n=1 Tax=Candidatus Nanosalina sp. VS9-1 TaxID=3388566 RepID=UPI0039E0D02D